MKNIPTFVNEKSIKQIEINEKKSFLNGNLRKKVVEFFLNSIVKY